ncbi:MAG: CopG family transcriptional regulator [Nitrospirae bacterium]|nr:CopG family transcriptional regulator [Nitrospirota bacterium]
MPSRQRSIMTISVPPAMAREYRELAKEKGENSSEFFREIFTYYKQQKLKRDLADIQQYGEARARKAKLTEKDIERLVFAGR